MHTWQKFSKKLRLKKIFYLYIKNSTYQVKPIIWARKIYELFKVYNI